MKEIYILGFIEKRERRMSGIITMKGKQEEKRR